MGSIINFTKWLFNFGWDDKMHENKLDWKRGYKDEKPTVTTHFNCFVVMKWMKKREWNGTDWLVVMIFGSVRFLLKIIIKLNFFFLKWNRFKPTGFGSVILEQKPVFSGLVWFFSVWLGFFGLGSVQFFWFQAYKTEPIGFFKILIGLIFFFTVQFFSFFFLVFSI